MLRVIVVMFYGTSRTEVLVFFVTPGFGNVNGGEMGVAVCLWLA